MPGLPFNDFLADDDIAEIINHTPHKRESIFTPLVTLKAFIFQTLSADGSCKDAVASVLADRLNEGKSANRVECWGRMLGSGLAFCTYQAKRVKLDN